MSIDRRISISRYFKGENIVKICIRVILLLMAVVYVYPVVFAGQTSLKTLNEFYQDIWALPRSFLYENYIEAFFTGKIGEYFLNSIVIAVTSIFFIQLFSTMAAYALTRLKIPFVGGILLLLFFLQILPTETTIIPLYIQMTKTGIMKFIYVPIVVAYVGWSIPGSTIILKNYFETVPRELVEAARIDGCGEIRTLLQVILPLVRGAIITVATMNLNFVWGELMWAQISTLLTTKGIPLTVGLLNFKGQISTNWPQLCAAILIVVLPLYLLFLFAQKYFIAGLTAGGVKG